MPAARKPAAKRLPLPKRFSASMTDAAYDRLRALNARYGLSNNYLLVVLLERLDDYANPEALDAAFAAFIDEYGAPAPGGMGAHRSSETPGDEAG